MEPQKYPQNKVIPHHVQNESEAVLSEKLYGGVPVIRRILWVASCKCINSVL